MVNSWSDEFYFLFMPDQPMEKIMEKSSNLSHILNKKDVGFATQLAQGGKLMKRQDSCR